MDPKTDSVDILGVAIPLYTKQRFLLTLEHILQSTTPQLILPVSSRYLVKTQKDQEYKNILQRADIIYPDGIGLRIGAYFNRLKAGRTFIGRLFLSVFQMFFIVLPKALFYPSSLTTLPQSINFTDNIWNLLEIASRNNKRVYILGTDFLEKDEARMTLELAVQEIKKRLPDLLLVGYQKGLSIHTFKLETPHILQTIKNTKPDILIVSFMDSYEARWLEHNYRNIPSLSAAIGVGGTFDFIAQNRSRGPVIIRSNFEWLWRLVQEPWRLRRVCQALFLFLWKLYWSKVII